MAKIYLYFPFNHYAKDSVLQNDPAAFTKSGLNFEKIFTPNDCDGIKNIATDDLLIICAHGDRKSPALSMSSTTPFGKLEVSKTASDVAGDLNTAKLNKKHEAILLITCWGGGSSTLQGTAQPEVGTGKLLASALATVENKTGECLASILAKAMGQLGYGDIVVGGFPGSFITSTSKLGGKSSFEASGKDVLAQLDHIQWFDARGLNTVEGTSRTAKLGHVV